MANTCTDRYDFCLIRGDVFTMDVGLSSSFVEVVETPSDYEARLVFRETQDDNATVYLTLTATPVVNPVPLLDEVPITVNFSATAAQTQLFPQWNVVAYCELVFIGTTAPVGGSPTRLFNSDVEVSD